MTFIFMTCTIFAIICYRYNSRSEHVRWMCLVLIFGAMAGLSRAIIETFIPTLRDYNAEIPIVTQILIYIRIFTGFVSVNFFPWALLMFAISYTTSLAQKTKTVLSYLLLIPIPLMINTTVFFPDIKLDFKSLAYWAVPYIVIASGMLFRSYFTEKDIAKKKDRFSVNMIGQPAILSSLVLNYIIRIFDDTHQYWRYMALLAGVAFVIFLARALLDGVFGIRLTFVRKAREETMKAITSGTAILNHTLKNEIIKISIAADNIQSSTYGKETEIRESLQTITNATNHMNAMVTRIHGQMQDVTIRIKEEDLNSIIDQVLQAVRPFIEQKNIQVSKIYHTHPTIFCDAVHIKEVISNIVKNAIEAVNDQGYIKIETETVKKAVLLKISDNGQGITKENLRHVLDPFFSTKRLKGQNFGLGLTYCDQVMKKHKGHLRIYSEEHLGTTVALQFPCLKKARFKSKV